MASNLGPERSGEPCDTRQRCEAGLYQGWPSEPGSQHLGIGEPLFGAEFFTREPSGGRWQAMTLVICSGRSAATPG
jgi:hypothetical protein